MAEGLQQQAQKNPEPCQQAPEVIAGGGKHGVDGVSLAVGQEVPVHSVVFFAVADDRLDGGAAFELTCVPLGRCGPCSRRRRGSGNAQRR